MHARKRAVSSEANTSEFFLIVGAFSNLIFLANSFDLMPIGDRCKPSNLEGLSVVGSQHICSRLDLQRVMSSFSGASNEDQC